MLRWHFCCFQTSRSSGTNLPANARLKKTRLMRAEASSVYTQYPIMERVWDYWGWLKCDSTTVIPDWQATLCTKEAIVGQDKPKLLRATKSRAILNGKWDGNVQTGPWMHQRVWSHSTPPTSPTGHTKCNPFYKKHHRAKGQLTRRPGLIPYPTPPRRKPEHVTDHHPV